MELSVKEKARYARHFRLPEVGEAGQGRLRAASVVCVGAGGLGSPVLLYLAAAGIGRLGVVDDDVVEESNLQRQILHGTDMLGRSKTDSARQSLLRVNPHINVVRHPVRLTAANAQEILGAYDVVIDGTDNFTTRYLMSDTCVQLKKPHLYGSVSRFEGQVTVLAPHLGGPCYRCLFPEAPPAGTVPSSAEAGILGVVPGIIGCIQATETLKLLLHRGELLLGRLLLLDALTLKFREIKVRPDPACPGCGQNSRIVGLAESTTLTADQHPTAG